MFERGVISAISVKSTKQPDFHFYEDPVATRFPQMTPELLKPQINVH